MLPVISRENRGTQVDRPIDGPAIRSDMVAERVADYEIVFH